MLDALAQGLSLVLQWNAFSLMLVGMALGFVVGLLPGIGGAATLALMLPFVFKMSPVEAFAFLLGITGVFGVFLFNQTASLLQTLASVQEDWLRWIGYGGLILFGACVLYSFLRFLFIYARMRENRQLRVKGIKELSKRTRLRWLAAQKSATAGSGS